MNALARFEDKVVLITAAASGIGAAAAQRMASEGARVVGVDRDGDTLAAMLAQLPGGADRHLALVADCMDEQAVQDCVRKALEFGGGRIDVLVNGVGGSTLKPAPEGGMEFLPLEDWNALLQFNLTPTFLLCKHVMPGMKARRAGKIVNLSSIAARGEEAKVGSAAYSASKAGVSALTKRISREMAPFGVNCNAVAPGGTKTPRLMRYYDTLAPQVRADAEARIPLGRRATVQDQASAIAFLASSDADFITGVILDVTGGQ